MPKLPTQKRATTNKQKVYFRATRMRENVRQKSTAQISRQTCVAQQNVQAVCKRVLVWFAICNSQSVKQPPTTHLFCCQARFFCNLCVGIFLSARKLTIMSLAREKHFSALHQARFQRKFCSLQSCLRFQARFFAIYALTQQVFVGTQTHYYEPCKGKAFFCVASGEVST